MLRAEGILLFSNDALSEKGGEAGLIGKNDGFKADFVASESEGPAVLMTLPPRSRVFAPRPAAAIPRHFPHGKRMNSSFRIPASIRFSRGEKTRKFRVFSVQCYPVHASHPANAVLLLNMSAKVWSTWKTRQFPWPKNSFSPLFLFLILLFSFSPDFWEVARGNGGLRWISLLINVIFAVLVRL